MDELNFEQEWMRLRQASRVTLNIGGERFNLRWEKMNKLPNSRLGMVFHAANIEEVMELCDELDFTNNEIYFDRPSKTVHGIIDYYRTGKLHMGNDTCIISFYDDLCYWGIDDNFFEPCCNLQYRQRKENAIDEIFKVDEFEKEAELRPKQTTFTNIQFTLSIVSFVSIFFVFLSSLTLVLSTLQIFKIAKIEAYSNSSMDFLPTEKITYVENPIFEYIELVCIVYFTFEYLLRIGFAPNKLQSMRHPLNIIDLISILPFYISLLVDKYSDQQFKSESTRFFTLFRILRVLRIFKLVRHSKGLKAFGMTLRKSSNELGMLFFFMGIQILFFSSLVYFAEKEEEGTKYTSIPATFWWAVISITTVGYGDMTPTTPLGKFIGAFCCISGILVIATPIPIIVKNFSEICVNMNKKEKVVQYKMERKNHTVVNLSESLKKLNEISEGFKNNNMSWIQPEHLPSSSRRDTFIRNFY